MKKTLLAIVIVASLVGTASAATATQGTPLNNFYIGAQAGLAFYTSGFGYSGTTLVYSPNFGYNFKSVGVPVRVDLGYQSISGSGLNAYYDLPSITVSSKELTPYIEAGIGSYGYNAGAGISYDLTSKWKADLGANYGHSTATLYSFSAVGVILGARYSF